MQCVSKDKAFLVILVAFGNMPSALQMLYVFIGYMLWLPIVLSWNMLHTGRTRKCIWLHVPCKQQPLANRNNHLHTLCRDRSDFSMAQQKCSCHMHAAKLASPPKAAHRVNKTVSPVQVTPRNSCTQAATQILAVCLLVCVVSLCRITIRMCCSF